MNNRLAIFDCDGTLVDSQANICVAMEVCFQRAGLAAPSRAQTRRVVGLNLIEAMRVMLPDAKAEIHEALVEDYKRSFHRLRSDGWKGEPLYEGMNALIETLDRDGWLLGIATGKSDRGLRLCLEQHGLHPRFTTLQTADRHPSKPHPSMVEQAMRDAGAKPATTIMVGDTSYDIAMALSAGVTAIGVTWGYHSPEELHAAGAHFIAGDPAEILTFARAFA